MKNNFVKPDKKLVINGVIQGKCTMCNLGNKSALHYQHPVYGNPDNPYEITAYFRTKKSLTELGLSEDAKIMSINCSM